jgi:hypothetical protein
MHCCWNSRVISDGQKLLEEGSNIVGGANLIQQGGRSLEK